MKIIGPRLIQKKKITQPGGWMGFKLNDSESVLQDLVSFSSPVPSKSKVVHLEGKKPFDV